MTFTTNR